MEKEVKGRTIELEPNSQPYFLKQIIADGFDTVLLFLLFFVLSLAFRNTPLASTHDEHVARYTTIIEETSAAYPDDPEGLTQALTGNEEFRYEKFAADLHAYLINALAGFVGEAVVLLIVPLLNRYRQTPGKMLTGVMPFSRKKQSRISRLQVVGRFVFVLLFYSLSWYLVTGIYTFLLIPVLRLIVMLLNRKRRTLLDLVTGVHIIEKLSYDGLH